MFCSTLVLLKCFLMRLWDYKFNSLSYNMLHWYCNCYYLHWEQCRNTTLIIYTDHVWLLLELIACSNILNTPEFIKSLLSNFRILWQYNPFMGTATLFKWSNCLGHNYRMRFRACGMQVIWTALGNTLLKTDLTAFFIKETLLDIQPGTHSKSIFSSTFSYTGLRMQLTLNYVRPINIYQKSSVSQYEQRMNGSSCSSITQIGCSFQLPVHLMSMDQLKSMLYVPVCAGRGNYYWVVWCLKNFRLPLYNSIKNQLVTRTIQGEDSLLTNSITIKIIVFFRSVLPDITPGILFLTCAHVLFHIFSVLLTAASIQHNNTVLFVFSKC